MTDDEITAVLRVMAYDAFEVLNWARRLGFKREKQIDQVVSAYRKTLKDTDTTFQAYQRKQGRES